jgi:WD40 repeat protein
MFGLKPSGRQTWKKTWRHQLSEYVTQIVWSPDGNTLAACSAAGEIVIQSLRTDASAPLGRSVFSCRRPIRTSSDLGSSRPHVCPSDDPLQNRLLD